MSKKKIVKADPTIGFIRARRPFRLGEHPGDLERMDPISMTQPGMAMTMDQLLNRFVSGREVPVLSDPVYEGHLNIPDVRVMDKVEREEYRRSVYSALADYNSRLAAAREKEELSKIEQLQATVTDLQAKLARVPEQKENSE